MDKRIKELIKVRLEKAREDIDTAVELLSLKRYRAAVNRSYYALFSVTTAVLLTKRLERSKHSGVEAAFNQHFIKTGIIEIEYGKIFNYIRRKREESDYTVKVMIDKETASLHREIAKKLRIYNELWDIPKRNLTKWKKNRGAESAAIIEWENIFKIKTKEEILSILEGDNEESIRLRSSSPFTGILNENERREIFEFYNKKYKNDQL